VAGFDVQVEAARAWLNTNAEQLQRYG